MVVYIMASPCVLVLCWGLYARLPERFSITPEACMAIRGERSRRTQEHRSGWYPPGFSFSLARLVLYLKRRTLLRSTLPPVIQARRGNVGMPQVAQGCFYDTHMQEQPKQLGLF